MRWWTSFARGHNFSRLEDDTFTELLILTAIQNRWPGIHNKWPKDEYANRAKALFEKIRIHRINHPAVPKPKEGEAVPEGVKPQLDARSWSRGLLDRIDELQPLRTVAAV